MKFQASTPNAFPIRLRSLTPLTGAALMLFLSGCATDPNFGVQQRAESSNPPVKTAPDATTSSQTQVQMLDEMTALKREIQRLQGRVEEQQQRLEESEQRSQELESRLQTQQQSSVANQTLPTNQTGQTYQSNQPGQINQPYQSTTANNQTFNGGQQLPQNNEANQPYQPTTANNQPANSQSTNSQSANGGQLPRSSQPDQTVINNGAPQSLPQTTNAPMTGVSSTVTTPTYNTQQPVTPTDARTVGVTADPSQNGVTNGNTNNNAVNNGTINNNTVGNSTNNRVEAGQGEQVIIGTTAGTVAPGAQSIPRAQPGTTTSSTIAGQDQNGNLRVVTIPAANPEQPSTSIGTTRTRENSSISAAGKVIPQVPATAEAQQSYDAALELLKQSRFNDAIAAFESMLANHGNSDLADDATFWVSEARYVSRDFEPALAGYQAVLQQFPASERVPESLLKIGVIQAEMGALDEARTTYQQVMQRFPGSRVALSAQGRLEKITQ